LAPGAAFGAARAESAFQALIRARKRPKTAGESVPAYHPLAPANRANGPRWRPWRLFGLGVEDDDDDDSTVIADEEEGDEDVTDVIGDVGDDKEKET
jgi:hypothetical protein